MRRLLTFTAAAALLCAAPAFADVPPDSPYMKGVTIRDGSGAQTGIPGNPLATSPLYGASGVTAQTVTVNGSAAATGWMPVQAGRPYDIFFKLTNFTGTCQQEVSPDGGTTAYTTTVTASGSTTSMQVWSFSNATQNIREQGQEFETGMNVRTNCTATSSGTAVLRDAQ